MRRPRRPGPGRSALRRAVRGPARSSPEEGRSPRPVALTTRAAVLGLVLCALVVSAALPLREYLAQRGSIAELQHSQVEQKARVAALERERALLDDPSYVAALARSRLHFVKPGETAYVVLGPEPAPAPGPSAATTLVPGEQAPWWSSVWSSVQGADGPTG